MTDTLLRSLRERLLDESEPLAGLLRKCLLLGAETGSEALRTWARLELKGYDCNAELPTYRKLPTPIIKVSYVGGMTLSTNQQFNRSQLPAEAQKVIPESVSLYQPVDELEKLAKQKAVSFSAAGLVRAQAIWNQQTDWTQKITSMSFEVSASTIAGVLGQIRTQLIDVVADLTADTPLTELPRKDQVDAAIGTHIGTQYNTNITSANGPTAIGTRSQATSEGFDAGEVLRLLDVVISASEDIDNSGFKADMLAAVEDLRLELRSGVPDTGTVVKKARKLKSVAATVGISGLSAAVGGVVEAVTAHAISGTFG